MAEGGRKPNQPSAVLKDNGEPTRGPNEVKVQWYNHFNKILNMPSEYQEEVIEGIPSQPTR